MRGVGGILFDLDMTIVDTSALHSLRAARSWNSVYAQIPKTSLFPGIREAIESLTGRYLCGIVTTSPRTYAERVLTHHKITLPVLVAYHDTPQHKPHPGPILLGVSKLGLAPQSVASIGDDPSDVSAGHRAGVVTIAVTWGGSPEADFSSGGPSYIVDTPRQLVDLLLDKR